jgi:glycosyltransferase involved in cell wall biosynthesis
VSGLVDRGEGPYPSGAEVVHHFGPSIFDVGGMASVLKLIRDHRIGSDAVCLHPTWRPGAPFASARLAARGARAIVGMSGGIVHVHLSEGGSFLREGALLMLANRLGLATVTTIHGADFVGFAHRHPRLVGSVLRSCNRVICLSSETFEVVGEVAGQSRALILPNPVEVFWDSSPADQTSEVVLFVGELGLRKGADVLAEAWPLVKAQRPDAKAIAVGPPTDLRLTSCDGLTFAPTVDRDRLAQLHQEARVVVLPSRGEAMPMALLEAMARGRPFVSTPVGGIPELANHGGVLAPVGDPHALAAALTALLSDPALAASLGARGRAYCAHTRSVEVIDRRMREIYGGLR